MSDDLTNAITGGIESVTKQWAKQRKAEERSASARLRREQVMTSSRGPTIKDAAYQVMEQAYLKASGNGRLFANARQVMYAARPAVLAITGGRIWKDDAYFTQHLLPDYVAEHGLNGVWKIAYDARGHLVEPHRGRHSGGTTSVPLGTLEVRNYQQARPDEPLDLKHLPTDFPTAGPKHRYSAAVFIEKEGFDQQIAESGLADRFDVAFMSTKGVSNTASRELVDHLASLAARLFIVRDFDKAGFTIAGTLATNSRRYRFWNQVDVVDLGLRLADVEAYDLESEPWVEKVSPEKVRRTLRRHGATDAEVDFLVEGGSGWGTSGLRVELNALTSDQFVEWLEDKLDEHGVEKVIPDADVLAAQFRRALARHAVNAKIDEIAQSIRDEADRAAVPDNLAARVQELLDDDPSMSWDEAVAQIAKDGTEATGGAS